jgi:hypothetical protein
MAYDAATSQLVLFRGGNGVNNLGDTWVWTGSNWSQSNPATSPSVPGSMAYDAATSQLLLFDGASTWLWTGSTWSQLSPSNSPSARYGPVIAYDQATSQLILFGGEDTGGTSDLGDTWVWTGTTWSQLSPPNSPLARTGAAMAYDSSTNQLLLFGGGNPQSGPLTDTWIWTGSNWVQQFPTTSPTVAGNMAYDQATNQLLLYEVHVSSGNTLVNDTWVWTGSDWVQQSPAASPPSRVGAAMAYDSATSQLLLFGGEVLSGGNNNYPFYSSYTWDWTGSTWSLLTPSNSPSGRENAAMAYDQATSQLILFGGYNPEDNTDGGYLDDTWVWTGSTWQELSPATSPSARASAAMAYDSATSQLILFGGSNASSAVNDTWVWTASTWSQLSPSASPNGPGTMAFDQATNQLVFFNGTTWIWTGSTWSQQNPATSPTVGNPMIAYDPATSQLLAFGGTMVTGVPPSISYVNTTWIWTGSTWSQLNPSPSPLARASGTMFYDQAASQLVLFGGSSGNLQNDTWTWAGNTWNLQNPATIPQGRSNAAMAYDPATSQLLLFGGYSSYGGSYGLYLNDTWQLGEPPSITSSTGAAITVGTSGSFVVTSTGIPTSSLSESGVLPGGVAFVDNHNGTATLSGTPQTGSSGAYNISLTASNGISPNAIQSFTLTVPQVPTPTPQRVYLPFVPDVCSTCSR